MFCGGVETGVGLIVRRRGIGLPKRHDVGAQFKLAAEDAGMNDRTEGLGRLKAKGKKFKR